MFSFVQYIWDMYILTTLFVSWFLNSVFYEHKASYEIKKYSRKISSIMLHCNMTNNHAMENLVATFSFFHLKPNRYYHILWLLEQTQCLPDTWCCTVYLPLRNVLTHRWFFFVYLPHLPLELKLSQISFDQLCWKLLRTCRSLSLTITHL